MTIRLPRLREIRLLRPKFQDRRREGRGKIFGRGMLVAAVNPKTIAFLAAFLPQFVDGTRPVVPQFVVLGATFLAVLFAVDASYALMAGRLRRLLTSPRAAVLRGRFASICLVGTSAWLALSDRG